jgi:hypothetical protein
MICLLESTWGLKYAPQVRDTILVQVSGNEIQYTLGVGMWPCAFASTHLSRVFYLRASCGDTFHYGVGLVIPYKNI